MGNKIFVKREDLLPFSFGGNKYRIALEYIKDMKAQACDCLVVYGNARSNLCRVASNLCASLNIPCVIISPADEDGSRKETYNYRFSKIFKGKTVPCTKNNVAETVLKVMDDCRKEGLKPYYIYGDETGSGRKDVPVRAYVPVYSQILAQEKESGVVFDNIFVTAATGSTLAGLLAGRWETGVYRSVIGVAVARNKEATLEHVGKYFTSYTGAALERAELTYVEGKYESISAEVEETILEVMTKYGIPLDPTYTGKGFYGMKKYLEDGNITGKNILFIHTGGTPLFFDLMAKF